MYRDNVCSYLSYILMMFMLLHCMEYANAKVVLNIEIDSEVMKDVDVITVNVKEEKDVDGSQENGWYSENEGSSDDHFENEESSSENEERSSSNDVIPENEEINSYPSIMEDSFAHPDATKSELHSTSHSKARKKKKRKKEKEFTGIEISKTKLTTKKPPRKQPSKTNPYKSRTPLIIQHFKSTTEDQMARNNTLKVAHYRQGECLTPQEQCISIADRGNFNPNCVLIHLCTHRNGCCDNPEHRVQPTQARWVRHYFHSSTWNSFEKRPLPVYFIFPNQTACKCGMPGDVTREILNENKPVNNEPQCACPKGFYVDEDSPKCSCDCVKKTPSNGGHVRCEKIKNGRSSYQRKCGKKLCGHPKCNHGPFTKHKCRSKKH